jgi:CheY-like chemotaxis protein
MVATQRFRPEEGDLVIREGSRDGEPAYILHMAPGPDQYLVRSRDEAIAQATRFATCSRVRVWIESQNAWTLVGDFRQARVAGPPQMRTDRRPLILLVQPERDDRDMYVEFLGHVGFTPTAVSTAVEALRIVWFVDLIVTGVLLPGHMNGVALVKRLKSDERTKRIPVIALTACAWHADRKLVLNAGCDAFLSKPCPPQVLAREIRRLLAHCTATAAQEPHVA